MDELEARLHTLIRALLYPAFLGTLIVSLVAKAPNLLSWQVFFVAYFALQFVETSPEAGKFKLADAVRDLAEIAAMVSLFALNGYLVETPCGPDKQCFSIDLWIWKTAAAVLVLFIPPIVRIIRGDWPVTAKTQDASVVEAPRAANRFYAWLFCLSMIAIGLVVAEAVLQWDALRWAAWLILAYYAVAFVLFNALAQELTGHLAKLKKVVPLRPEP